jgi:arginine/serine-rich splicing factor 1/9
MSRIYVGNLPSDIREKEVDDLFYKFGRIRDIHVVRKEGAKSAFAFVEYSDYRDAEDAVHRRDGYRFDGDYIRCEISKERRRDGRDGGRDGGRDRNRDRDDRRGGGGGDRGDRPKRERKDRGERKPPPRSDFGVTVTGFAEGTKWRNLKEHFATVGPVVFADIKNDEGVVEFEKEEDMLEAIKKFDDSEFVEKVLKVVQAPPKPVVEEAAPAPTDADANANAGADAGADAEKKEGEDEEAVVAALAAEAAPADE